MENIFSLLKKNDIEVVPIELEHDGYYVPLSRYIFVSDKLKGEQLKAVILHELFHVLEHENDFIFYKNPSLRLKMENEANVYMIGELISEAEGFYNYAGVAEKYNLGIGWEKTNVWR